MTLVSVTSVTEETIVCVDQGLCKRISHIICFICTIILNGNSNSNIWALLRGPVASQGLYSQLTIANYDGKTGLVFKENV